MKLKKKKREGSANTRRYMDKPCERYAKGKTRVTVDLVGLWSYEMPKAGDAAGLARWPWIRVTGRVEATAQELAFFWGRWDYFKISCDAGMHTSVSTFQSRTEGVHIRWVSYLVCKLHFSDAVTERM